MAENREGEDRLSEQTVLWGQERDDPMWSHRFLSNDAVAELGDQFSINSHVTPRSPRRTSLISKHGIDEVARWLAHTLLKKDDGILRSEINEAFSPTHNPPIVSMKEAEKIIGFSISELPKPYAEWRFSVECYVLLGTALYMIFDGFLLRYKTLTRSELGQVFGPRLLPFVQEQKHELVGPMIFLVGCPVRLGALGGLRGYRRTYLDAGWAAKSLKDAAFRGGGIWHFETEFYDDAAFSILSVDGVERVPLFVGYQYEKAQTNLKERSNND